MPKEHDLCTVHARRPVLDESIVSLLEAEGQQTRHTELLLDCLNVQDITPRGLAALLEFGARSSGRRLAISGLSRHATLLAVQVGLAERWSIYAPRPATVGAPNPSLARSPDGMRAVIYETPENIGIGAMDVAGRPLLLRQLQALRDAGIEDVTVEIAEGPRAAERALLLLGTDPLTSRTLVIPSASPLGPAELARRAGFPEDELFLALPSTLALHAKLGLHVGSPTRFELAPPADVREPAVCVELRSLVGVPAASSTRLADGWGSCVTNHETAHILGCAALEGRAPGMIVHASETRPGVWIARGARVSPDATLLAPVLIGADARVFARAQVGPRAVIGASAVVEREAVVTDGSLEAGTILGESTRIGGAHAHAGGMVSFGDGARITLHDTLTLASREQPTTAWSSRLLALLLVGLLAGPWLLGTTVRRLAGRSSVRALPSRRGALHVGESGMGVVDLFPSLLDVLLGRRDLVGVGDLKALEKACVENHDSLRPGAFDLSAALAPGASTATLLRMWRWYRAHKNRALDRDLWRQRSFQPHPET